jgi:phosphatidyl-myo-inositol alpha-mannosyltransferase
VRIGIFSDYYYPQLGGITEHVQGQATELARRGHDVTVITPRLVIRPKTATAEEPPPRSFDLERSGSAWPFYVNGSESLLSLPGARGTLRLRRTLTDERFDVVHVHNPIGVVMPMATTWWSRARATVGTLHSVVPPGHPILAATRPLLHRVLRRLDATVAVSDAVVESLGPRFPDVEFTVIPNGVDTSFFSPRAEPIPELADTRNIVFVGRFDPRNGVRHMIGAFTALRRRRDDVRLVIVGDGPLRPLVERLVPASLRGDVYFAGRVNRLRPRYLASAEILCTPCSLASFGMVLLEGMSAGLPVVATRLPGFELVMRDGVHGLMVDRSDDEDGFARALERLLDEPALAQQMGAAGRERAVTTYDWPVVVDQLESLYGRLLSGRTEAAPLARAA